MSNELKALPATKRFAKSSLSAHDVATLGALFDATVAAEQTHKAKEADMAKFAKGLFAKGATLYAIMVELGAKHIMRYMMDRDGDGFGKLKPAQRLERARFLADGDARKALKDKGYRDQLAEVEQGACNALRFWKMSFLNKWQEEITGEAKEKNEQKAQAGAKGAAAKGAKGAQKRKTERAATPGEIAGIAIKPALTGRDMSPAQYVEFVRSSATALLSTMKAFNQGRKIMAPGSKLIEAFATGLFGDDMVEQLNGFACLPPEPPKGKPEPAKCKRK